METIDITAPLRKFERTPTDEQGAILDNPPEGVIVVDAVAGSGKTTTLVDYANRWKGKRGLYLAFNREIADHAKGRFPPWVSAQTTHSFAFKALGVSKYADRLGRIRRHTIRQAGIDVHSEYLTPDRMIRCILLALTNFCQDGGSELTVQHCGLEKSPLITQQQVLPRIAAVVKRFLAFETSGLPFTHDIYLKRLELAGGIGDAFDYLMLDEAQDSNGVTLSLVRKSGKPVLFIGDTRQGIYAFRGAVNAMELIEGKRFPLSMSWRFGEEVAKLCNAILSHSEKPLSTTVRGRPDRATTVEIYTGKAPSRSFIMSRTNARLFEGLIGLMEADKSGKGIPFHVAGGFDILANQLLSAYALSRNDQQNVKDPYVRGFYNWDDMLEEAAEEDPDAKKLVKIVKDYGDQIPSIIDRLRGQHRPHFQDARIILSTAHKAKGLEADNVIVLDDFPTVKELKARLLDDKLGEVEYEQELNLLYVAVSRARHRLLLAQSLYDEFEHVLEGENP